MAYSETRIVIGVLAYVPAIILMANFIKGKFRNKTKDTKDNVVKEELVKIIELINTEVKVRKSRNSKRTFK